MKNKINFKLVNIALVTFILFLIYRSGHLWTGIIGKVVQISTPFVIAFVIAYALYPLLKYLEDKKIPKPLAVFLIVALLVGLLSFVVFLIVPLLFNQTVNLLKDAISYVKDMSPNSKYDLGPIQNALTDGLNDIVMNNINYQSLIEIVNIYHMVLLI